MRKGQVEIIAVLAVIIIAVVAIIYAAAPSIMPDPVSQEGKSLKDTLSGLVSKAADESIRKLSLYGGYTEAQIGGAAFLGDSVTYWQRGGKVSVPQAKHNFVSATEDFINQNKEAFVSGFTDVTVGEATVVANFFDSKIDLTVSIPATLKGQPQPSTYSVTVPTKFGEILQFAEDFSNSQSRERYLEYFTLSTALLSPIENGEHTTPFFIALTGCGESVFKTWSDLKPAMENRISVTLGHTYMPGKAPLGVAEFTSYPKYAVPQLNGNRYSDIDVSFHLPDDFELSPSSFQFSPNPIIAVASPVQMTSVCVSDPIYVNYFLNFPVIVRAKDPITGNLFQFAHQVFIKDNEPGEWTDSSIYDQDVQALICSSLQCSLDLQVTSLSGEAVTGADVSFMGCPVGHTDSSGRLQGAVPCGIGPIQVLKSGYMVSSEQFSSDEFITQQQVTVPKMLNSDLFFYQVTVDDSGTSYTIKDIQPIPQDRKVMLTLSNPGQQGTRQMFDASGKLSYVPAGQLGVSATLTEENLQVAFGQILKLTTIPEDTGEIHIYVPYNILFSSLDAEAATSKAFDFTNLMEACGINPVAASPVNIDDVVPCVKGYDEV